MNIPIAANGHLSVNYNVPNIPVSFGEYTLSDYPQSVVLPHWHDELEFILVLEGAMFVLVNSRSHLLEKNDILFINSARIHQMMPCEGRECHFVCMLASPKVFKAALDPDRILSSVSQDSRVPDSCLLDSANAALTECAMILQRIRHLAKGKSSAFELEVLGNLYVLMARVFTQSMEARESVGFISPDLLIQRQMIAYIHQHYPEKMTLADIASAGGVCRSRCCDIFRTHTQMTPIRFLNDYRLSRSREMLRSGQYSIAEIANACGFSQQSYYTRMFIRAYNQTPMAWRHAYQESAGGKGAAQGSSAEPA